MFRPNFERDLVEQESCEENILLRDPSCSSLDAYVHTHAHTDVVTVERTEVHPHTLTHTGTQARTTRKQKLIIPKPIGTGISQN